VVFSRNGDPVRRLKQAFLAPSSMIRVRVRADRLAAGSGDLTVEVGA
jgi:hypothetical protein